MEPAPSAVIIGVGPEKGLGSALAMKCAREGLHVFIGGRSPEKLGAVAERIRERGGRATPVAADALDERQVRSLVESANGEGCALEFAAYNVDSNLRAPLLDTGVEQFTLLWKQNCLGGFIFGREAISQMLRRGRGSLFFTGASASLRAKPPFTAFSAAKSGLRALAQGMAREFSPQGIHVVHVVIDGVIDGDRARRQFPDLVASKGEDGMLRLDALADVYWSLHRQHPSAWTHELDLRPYKETF
ncbi:MAG: SDR family NAD(P)-dependent oxidoreductase [Gammaproteobacteria bacterium]